MPHVTVTITKKRFVGSVATSPVVLRWLCDSPRTGCAWRTTPYIYVARTSNNRVIMACELYCCLLPQCEALRICRSGFPIATAAIVRYINITTIYTVGYLQIFNAGHFYSSKHCHDLWSKQHWITMVFNETTNYNFILLSKQGRTQLIYMFF